MNGHDHHNKHNGEEEQEEGNDGDRGSRRLHVSSLRYYGMFIFSTFFFEYFTNFFYRLTTNDDSDHTNDGDDYDDKGLRRCYVSSPW